MPGLNKSFTRLSANALRRRIGRDQFRMLRLDPLKLVHQLVEFGVRKFRIIENVVEVFVMPNLLAQGVDLFLDSGTGHD